MTYNVCPCAICEQPLSYDAVREGVYWAQKQSFEGFWGGFWANGYPDERVEFAHKACWKRLTEANRNFIRKTSDKNFKPRSLNQEA